MVFSLASKGIATEFVTGLSIEASPKFVSGDYIALGDGTCGDVLKVDAFETAIKGSV